LEDYKKFYKGKKEQTKEEKGLENDYEHQKEVDAKNEKAIKDREIKDKEG